MAERSGKICLDTDIMIDYLKGKEYAKDLIEKLYLEFGKITITAITMYELLIGVEYMDGKDRAEVEAIISTSDILPFNKEASRESAKVSAELKRLGKQIGIADVLIAGICILSNSCLITKNIEHFRRIKNLQILGFDQL